MSGARNEHWDEGLSDAMEIAGAYALFEQLTDAQRDKVSVLLADWSEYSGSGGPDVPSNPEADDLRARVAVLEAELRKANAESNAYRDAVGKRWMDKDLADVNAEFAGRDAR